MEKKQSIENSGFMPQKGNPTQETVTYKIGGTFYEAVSYTHLDVYKRQLRITAMNKIFHRTALHSASQTP